MEPNLIIVLLGTLTITSYQPIPAQTKPDCRNRHDCVTSIGDGITMYGVAVSPDLLKSGVVKYGDVLDVPGFGLRVVNDVMGTTKCEAHDSKGHCIKIVPQVKSIDLMVFSYKEEHKVGVRHLQVIRYRQGEKKCNTKLTLVRKTRLAAECVKE